MTHTLVDICDFCNQKIGQAPYVRFFNGLAHTVCVERVLKAVKGKYKLDDSGFVCRCEDDVFVAVCCWNCGFEIPLKQWNNVNWLRSDRFCPECNENLTKALFKKKSGRRKSRGKIN